MPGPMHGYEIRKVLDQRLGDVWRVSTSRLYLLLQNLETEGFLTSQTTSETNRPPKKIYRITLEGREHFLSWVHTPAKHMRELRYEFIVKLFFLKHLGLKGEIDLIDAQIKVLKCLREKVDDRRANGEDPFLKVVRAFRRSQLDACLAWLQNEVRPFQENLEGPNSTDYPFQCS